jgi:hypothetical protein
MDKDIELRALAGASGDGLASSSAAAAAVAAGADVNGGPVVYTSVPPMQDAAWRAYLRQLRVMMRNDFTLAVRARRPPPRCHDLWEGRGAAPAHADVMVAY